MANLLGSKVNSGGAEEARTPDPLLAKQVLSQLSYSPIMINQKEDSTRSAVPLSVS